MMSPIPLTYKQAVLIKDFHAVRSPNLTDDINCTHCPVKLPLNRQITTMFMYAQVQPQGGGAKAAKAFVDSNQYRVCCLVCILWMPALLTALMI